MVADDLADGIGHSEQGSGQCVRANQVVGERWQGLPAFRSSQQSVTGEAVDRGGIEGGQDGVGFRIPQLLQG